MPYSWHWIHGTFAAEGFHSITYMLKIAGENSLTFRQETVKGEQTFWGMEAGNDRLNSSTREVIDESEE